MGILDSSLWKARWIGFEKVSGNEKPDTVFTRLAARYLRKEVAVKARPVRATGYICGLGLYELYLNGKKVGNAVLAPTVKEYNKAVPYNTLDLTPYFKTGNNAIGVILGNGRFFTVRYSKDGGPVNGIAPSTHYGFPKLIMQVLLEYADGSTQIIKTDDTWKVTTMALSFQIMNSTARNTMPIGN
jgi:alpha-L-rhamnosidase